MANPKAGRRPGNPIVQQLANLLVERGYAVEVMDDIERLSEHAATLLAENRLKAVVAAGGDGTFAFVANHTPLGAPLAVLPLGTENLLSKHLGLTRKPQDICDTISAGRTAEMDAGLAQTDLGDKLFFLNLSCGFDSDVVRRLDEKRRGNIHHLSYVKPILAAVRSYRYPLIRVTGAEETLDVRWVFVQNLPCYALGLQFVPQASGRDGQLDVCTFRQGSIWNGLRYLAGVVRRRHQHLADCTIFRTTRLRLESEEPIPYQLDGDHSGFLPLEVSIVPRRITLLVPPSYIV